MSQTATIPTLEVSLSLPSISKFERERRAFHRLLPDLLDTYRGRYVAIHSEQVVDSGSKRAELVQRVLDKVREDIYVGLVAEEPEPVHRSGIRRVTGEREPQL